MRGLLCVLVIGCGSGSPGGMMPDASCTGCITTAGSCEVGTEPAACGSGGAICTACSSYQVCQTLWIFRGARSFCGRHNWAACLLPPRVKCRTPTQPPGTR